MTVTDVRKDPTALTMTVASEWEAPIARVWQLWADPRKLERWWARPRTRRPSSSTTCAQVGRSATS